MLELRMSHWRPFGSRARAKYSPSSTHQSRLNRSFSSAASRSNWSANPGSPQNSRANRAARTFASYAYPCTSQVARGNGGSVPSE